MKKDNWHPLKSCLTIAKSKIEGLGVFATETIPENTDLGMSHVFNIAFPDNYIRTPLGGFINHHEIPNCSAEFRDTDPIIGNVKHIRIITRKGLDPGEEITVKYVINKLEDPNWEFEYEATQ